MKNPRRRQRSSVLALLVAVLVACMSMLSSPAHAEEPVFSDVPLSHPYYKEIAWMKSSGISTGWDDGTYRPSQQVDRDAMAAFFYRYLGSPEYTAPATSPFTDITTSIQFYKEMSWMKSTGISTGWPDGTYRPWNQTDRDAMAAFMYRVAGTPAYTPPTLSLFYDVEPSTQFYKEMSWVYQTGIANNADDGTFDPWEPVTREMMAVFMYRLANPPELEIQSAGLPGAVKGTQYSAVLRASGGSELPFTWSATGLPAGLSISPEGVISGTPTTEGNSTVQLTVTDAASNTTSKSLALRVSASSSTALEITTKSVPTGVVGSAYPGLTFVAENGVAPYKWTASGVPAGLSLSSDGKLTGTPTQAGQGLITVQVTDAEGVRASVRLDWRINSRLSITTNSLPMGVLNTDYSARVTAQGGVPGANTGSGYEWTATGLPSGLVIDGDGDIWGTPTDDDTFGITVTVTDTQGNKASKDLDLEIVADDNCDVLKCIAITFDDGPLDYSDDLKDAFVDAGAKATFYDVGVNIEKDPDASREKYEAGMEVGLHGWEHIYYSEKGSSYVRYDLDHAADVYEWAVGPWPTSWRPPYGYYNPDVAAAAGDVGLATIMWTDNTWDYEYTNASQLRRDTVDIASRDAVLLMHDGVTSSSRSQNGLWQLTAATAQAMPGIISDLQDQGYTLVTVSALLGEEPEAGEVYFDPNPTYHWPS